MIAFPALVFKVIVYFLTLVLTLKVFFLATNLLATLVILVEGDTVELPGALGFTFPLELVSLATGSSVKLNALFPVIGFSNLFSLVKLKDT